MTRGTTRIVTGIAIVLFWTMVFSCAERSGVRVAYDVANLNKTVYDVSLTAMGDLYRQGVISESVKEKAIEYGKVYKVAHNDAVESLAQWKENTSDPGLKFKYIESAADAAAALADFLDFVKIYLEVQVDG